MIAFNVPDMNCGACANRIGKALEIAGLPAELQIEIDLAAHQVRVPLALQTEIEQTVQKVISDLGYSALPAADVRTASNEKGKGGCCCAPERVPALDVNQGQLAPTAGCCG